jgi:glycerophosphoryl diester phosphodiesterase
VYVRVPGGPGCTARVAAVAAAGGAVEVPVRRTHDGALVCAEAPYGPGDPLADVLAAGRGRVLLDVPNVPGEPDFDAPRCETARLVAALRPDPATVTAVTNDWYACPLLRDAGLRVAFRPPRGVAMDAAVAYASDNGIEALAPHPSDVTDEGLAAARERGVAVVQTTTDSESGTDLNVSRSTSPR